jgi:hypothetical protein
MAKTDFDEFTIDKPINKLDRKENKTSKATNQFY